MDGDLSATDILMFDVKAARLNYLLNKRKQRKTAGMVVDAQAVVSKLFEPELFDVELPMFLRRQAE